MNLNPPRFQHTATRRWLRAMLNAVQSDYSVSTHSHPKVAAPLGLQFSDNVTVSTHSHPKVAAKAYITLNAGIIVSTHSHPKVAANALIGFAEQIGSFNTQPPEGGCGVNHWHDCEMAWVSTHSHPKVAALAAAVSGGGLQFQHTATRRWLHPALKTFWASCTFQHTATRRWLRVTMNTL